MGGDLGMPVTRGGGGGGGGGGADAMLISRLQEQKPKSKSRGLFKLKGLERRPPNDVPADSDSDSISNPTAALTLPDADSGRDCCSKYLSAHFKPSPHPTQIGPLYQLTTDTCVIFPPGEANFTCPRKDL